jgi:hypothetical protein
MIRHLGMLQVESRIKVEIERNMNEGEDLPRQLNRLYRDLCILALLQTRCRCILNDFDSKSQICFYHCGGVCSFTRQIFGCTLESSEDTPPIKPTPTEQLLKVPAGHLLKAIVTVQFTNGKEVNRDVAIKTLSVMCQQQYSLKTACRLWKG